MRIAIASSGLGHIARGIEAWAQDLGAALAERGEQAIVCQGGGAVQAAHQRLVPCYTRESSDARRVTRRLPLFLAWRLGLASGYGVEQTTFAWNLLRLLRRERIDILHVQDPQLALLIQQARRLRVVQTKTILAHGTEESLDFLRKITYLQHLAPWHLEEARAAGAYQRTWTAIPNFIDTDVYRPGTALALRNELGIPQDALVVLIAAAIKRGHKRVDYVQREFAQFRERQPQLPVWLVVAGGREEETEALISEGRELLGDRVRFLVRYPRERMPELYRAADLFVLGSLKEMMPIALLEATASGLPCVVNHHPVMQWMVGEGGIATDLAAPGNLAQELERLALDVKERASLGVRAREHCVLHFRRDAVVDQIMRYYAQVMSGKSHAPAAVLQGAN